MKTSPTKRSRAAWAALLLAGAAVPAIGQDTPESLLPPGFGDPAPAPPPAAPAPAPAPARAPESTPEPLSDAAPEALGNASAADEVAALVDLSKYELPAFARHSLARIGISAAGNAPFPADSLGSADGRYLMTLIERLDAPIASRWASIALRRALISPLDTPANVAGADFAAERAALLLRMGEAVGARAVINYVDPDDYTTRLYQIAMQAALANADPAQMCPIADRAAEWVRERAWGLARAMCAGLAGKPNEAGALFDSARRGTSPSDIDNLLAEKVLGAGAQSGRAVTIEWNPVTQLTAWRWGLATATGVEVPAALYDTVGPQVRYWQALAPALDPASRVGAAELAAAAGVFSNVGLVDLYAEIDARSEATGALAATIRDLRTAYSDGDVQARLAAIRQLWSAAESPQTRYARLILTARAASWIPADAGIAEPERLIASMLSAGLEAAAMEWRGVVPAGSEAWALLALADPQPASRIAAADFDSFAASAVRRKAQLLLAALAGLGRMAPADAERAAGTLDVGLGGRNSWTQAIDDAAERGEAATVAILAGIGLQADGWAGITPEALFHVVAAMRVAGLESYARMVAVEAITRA